MKKKLLPKILVWLLFSSFAYMIFTSYTMSNGFRDYKEYCSEFIPHLENYHQEHKKYPENLLQIADEKTAFNLRYSPTDCKYKRGKKGYSFVIADGILGIAGYESWKDEWWHD